MIGYFCLDADERLTPELAASIRATLADPGYFCLPVCRRNRFLGRYLCHGEGYPDWSLRLFDRRFAQWSLDAVHEVVCDVRVGDLQGDLQGDLLHDSAETLEGYLAKQNRYTTLAADVEAMNDERVSAARMIFYCLSAS